MTRNEALKVAELSTQRHQVSREIQWKINFAFWIIMISASVLKGKHELRFDQSGETWFAIVFSCTFFVFVFLTEYSLQKTSAIISEVYEQLNANNSKGEDLQIDVDNISPKIKTAPVFWFLFQCAVTVTLAVIYLNVVP